MQAITAKRLIMLVVTVFFISLLVGCAGMEKRPADRSGYLYYPTELVQADQALSDARMAGKDRQCPAEFNAAKDMVDKAYEVYMSCRTEESIEMAKAATVKISALCPSRPAAYVKPEPRPEPRVVEKLVEKGIVLEDVHFGFDKSSLTDEGQTILRRNIQILKQNPGMKVSIQGHTSAIGSLEYNQKLSERRAATVKAFLIKEGGIAPDRLTTIGYGETRLEMAEPHPEVKESAAAKVNRSVIFVIIVK
jgi:outer membrane protein OmpA-like peptidoglycan-associated protein